MYEYDREYCQHAHDRECQYEHDRECSQYDHDRECDHEHDREYCQYEHERECQHENTFSNVVDNSYDQQQGTVVGNEDDRGTVLAW